MDDDMHQVRRSLKFGCWKASAELEADFWDCLESIAELRGMSVDALAREVSLDFVAEDLAAALRVFVLAHFRSADAEAGSNQSTKAVLKAGPSLH